jgi:GGDEF domain-containing protein
MEKYKGKEDLVFRIGGDEFLVVFVNKSKSEIDLVKDKRLDTRRIDFYLKKADRLMYNHKAKVKSYGEFKPST